MVGGRADRVRRRLVAREQLAATAGGDRRGDVEQPGSRPSPMGSSRKTSNALAGRLAAPGHEARARSRRPAVTSDERHRQTAAQVPTAYGLGAEAEQDRRRPATARTAARRTPGEVDVATAASVEESAVGTGPLLAGHLARRRRWRPVPRRAGRARTPQAWIASSRRWVETRIAGAAGAGVGDHVEGRLDADRVDAVEGLVEQQHLGLVQRGQARPRAGGPCRGEKPPVTRCATSPSSKRSSRSRARSSQSSSRRSRADELEVLPRRRARHQAAHVGAVAG